MIIDGWFQSEKYFKNHKREILELFATPEPILKYLKETYDDILNQPCTVAIHHRSYLKEDPNQQRHPTLTKDYFLKAITYFPEDAIFVVFSNDITWCKFNF